MIRESFVSKYNEYDYSFEEFIIDYKQKIYSLLDSKEINVFKLYTYAELMVAYSDFYKLMSLKKKQNIDTIDDYWYLCDIDCISDVDDLKVEISAVPGFLEKILKSMYEFYMLSFLGRSNLFRNLSELEDEYLTTITGFHQYEKEEYKREITLEDYILHFQMKQEVLKSNHVVGDLNINHIIDEICGFITNLSKYDYENYQNNIKDLLIFYYEWVKYDCLHEKNLIDEDIEIKEEFILQFETMTFDDMANSSIYDYNFLFAIVEFYLMNNNKGIYYEDGRKVEYSEVDKYIDSLEDDKVKEKIKYKKTRI